MKQLPIFLNMAGRKVILLGEGNAADAKRRLIERAGGICTDTDDADATIAFIAIEDETQAISAADRLRARGLLVNVVDRPEHCDFTTPAIVDRDPVLIAVGTGGASAGLAKAVRQRIEYILPESLGALANAIHSARAAIRKKWPDAALRRRMIDAAFTRGGRLDISHDHSEQAVDDWLAQEDLAPKNTIIATCLSSNNPEDLTVHIARMLGEADHVFHDADVSPQILSRARADAVLHIGPIPRERPDGLIVYLRLPEAL